MTAGITLLFSTAVKQLHRFRPLKLKDRFPVINCSRASTLRAQSFATMAAPTLHLRAEDKTLEHRFAAPLLRWQFFSIEL